MISKCFSVVFLINFFGVILSSNAPVLDVDAKIGYHGKIGEKNILVDLTPHLQIKNPDQINGICSYHVYKPNNEDFPFTIDIKDKTTGEAVIQLGYDEITNQYNELNCMKRRFYTFFIEAHDCTPVPASLASEKIPVNIEIIDHNDHKLSFDEIDYFVSLTEDKIDDAIVIVKAKDEDCTNDGFACRYEIVEKDAPFKINKLGFISNARTLKRSEKIRYNLTVRGYDCLDDSSFAETSVHIDVVEPCKPEWSGFSSLVNATSVETQIFTNNLKLDLCDDDESTCTLDGYSATVELDLNSFGSGCEVEKCGEVFTKYEFLDNTDSYETQEPSVFEAFKKGSERTIKTDFDGNFGNSFQLKAWIKRAHDAINTDVKEHVFCGSDSELYNRHHFGLYFYRNNVKFLLRREKTANGVGNSEEFYPSLWEWSIDSIEGDGKWHLYEIKYSYPNAALYIDGEKFEENTTNSDVIDAHELDTVTATGIQVTYVGGCYNARSHSFSNYFNGEVAGLNLFREQPTDKPGSTNKIECVKNCKEYLDLNMIGNENFLKSIELIQNNLIKLKTQTVTDLITLLQKISYINKNLDASSEALTKEKIGKRFVLLKAEMYCYKNPSNNTDESKTVKNIKDLVVDVEVKKPKQEFNIQIEGSRQYLVSKDLLYSKGISLFKDVEISTISINKVNDAAQSQKQPTEDSSESLESVSGEDGQSPAFEAEDNLYFSSCSVRITPPNKNEKFVLTPFNEDELFGSNDAFKLSKVNDVILISGVNTVEDYENYLKNLLYTITLGDNDEENAYKQFYLSCVRDEPSIETNTILIQLNVTSHKEYIAFKKMNKFTADDGIVENKVFDASPSNSNTVKASSPIIVVVIVLSSGLLAFLLVLTALRMKNSRERRRGFQPPNEENPQMEWDDETGLNITENPLEELEANPQREIYNEDDADDSSSSGDGSENYGDYYNSEDEPEKVIEKELEWDDDTTTLEINERKAKRSNSEYTSVTRHV